MSEIIDCAEIEPVLRGNDESECSENSTVFTGMVDFVASVDAVVQEHLCYFFFKGTSKTVQSELTVLREHMVKEVRSADF